jgi:hypothetical protein
MLKRIEQFKQTSSGFRTVKLKRRDELESGWMDRHSTPPAASDPVAEGDEGAGKEAQVRQGAFGAEGGGKPTKAGERERMEPWSHGLSVQRTPLLG